MTRLSIAVPLYISLGSPPAAGLAAADVTLTRQLVRANPVRFPGLASVAGGGGATCDNPVRREPA